MAVTRRHVLRCTDDAYKAFIESKRISAFPASKVHRAKEVKERHPPFVEVNSKMADRGRAKNWRVTTEVTVHTAFRTEPGRDTTQMNFSDDAELAVLDAFEYHVPDDDRPQPLAAAIQAAGVAAGVVDADGYLMNDCRITDVTQDADPDGYWAFTISLEATVIFSA